MKGEIDSIKEAMEAGAQHGMLTFDQAIFRLWKDGDISEVEALRNADSPNNLRLKMKMATLEESDDDGNSIDHFLGKGEGGDSEGGLELSR